MKFDYAKALQKSQHRQDKRIEKLRLTDRRINIMPEEELELLRWQLERADANDVQPIVDELRRRILRDSSFRREEMLLLVQFFQGEIKPPRSRGRQQAKRWHKLKNTRIAQQALRKEIAVAEYRALAAKLGTARLRKMRRKERILTWLANKHALEFLTLEHAVNRSRSAANK